MIQLTTNIRKTDIPLALTRKAIFDHVVYFNQIQCFSPTKGESMIADTLPIRNTIHVAQDKVDSSFSKSDNFYSVVAKLDPED